LEVATTSTLNQLAVGMRSDRGMSNHSFIVERISRRL
jgi:hypothetical protein